MQPGAVPMRLTGSLQLAPEGKLVVWVAPELCSDAGRIKVLLDCLEH